MTGIFEIFKVDTAAAEKIAVSVNEPHQHDHEELIIGMEGQIEHFIDFKTIEMDTPFVSFITKSKIHRFRPMIKNNQCDMWVIRFKSEFIAETIFQLYSYFHEYATLQFERDEAFRRIISICEIIHGEMQQENPDYSIVRHLLSAIFIMIKSESSRLAAGDNERKSVQNTTLNSFIRILEDNYHRPVGADFYAEKLFMSTRNLNLICKNLLQQTVSEIIETRKLIEAKNQLTHTDKNISEIGYDLGYNEKAYFTNVFKRRTGQTPTEFRNEMNKLFS